jgi:hypothetical protein
MSHFEFFAELYALHYDGDDEDRKLIPKKVANWLETHIGAATTADAASPAPKRKRAARAPKRTQVR